MTQYLLAVHSVEGEEVPSEDEMQALYAAVDVFNTELQEEGAWVFGGGLQPVETATVVQVRGGRIMTTDGPFSESKEQIGGFWIIEAPDDEAAFAIAARATRACDSPVEVRAFQSE